MLSLAIVTHHGEKHATVGLSRKKSFTAGRLTFYSTTLESRGAERFTAWRTNHFSESL